MQKPYWKAGQPGDTGMPENHKKSDKVMISISIAIIGLMLFFNVAIFRTYQNNLLTLQEDHMITTAKAVANGLRNYYEEGLIHFEMYFDHGEADEEAEPLIAAFCEQQKGVSSTAVVGKHGEVIRQHGIGYEDYYPDVISEYRAYGQSEAVLLPPVLTGERHYTQFMVKAIGEQESPSRYVIAAIETEWIYQLIVQPVRIGDNGYSMVKNYDGTILMHKATNQIGLDAVAGRYDQYKDYDLDLENLEAWVERQRHEPQGSGIIKSYWWEDEQEPVETQKVVAYTQVPVGREDWIVNCTLDYKEIQKPLAKTRNLVLLLTLGIMTVFGVLLVQILNNINRRRGMEQELKHLAEMNAAWEELHKREQQIRHNDKMKTLGTMTSMIAHEFNNFLTPIMLYGEMLADNPQLDEEDRMCLLEIVEASRKAKELTGELSQYGRTEPYSTKKVTVYVAREIERSLKIIRKTLPTNVSLEQCLGPDEGYGLLANAGMVNQIVVNLCTNAVHAMQNRGGTLTVKGIMIEEGGMMKYGLTIEDTGNGMPEEILNRIFTPFYTTKESGVGTGLGLSVVQDLIHQVSGDINVISVVGTGTRFDILLPLFKIGNTESESRTGNHLSCKKVCIIDDDEAVGKALEKGLKRECRKVCLHTAPAPALAEIRAMTGQWDIIITDYSMPMMNGLELAGILRSLGYTGVIILISGAMEADTGWYLDNGIIQAALEKPVTVSDIQSSLNFLTDIKN